MCFWICADGPIEVFLFPCFDVLLFLLWSLFLFCVLFDAVFVFPYFLVLCVILCFSCLFGLEHCYFSFLLFFMFVFVLFLWCFLLFVCFVVSCQALCIAR